jgi:predicted kinase
MLNNQVAEQILDDDVGNRPVIYVMVGIPGCGKSTFIDKILNAANDYVVLSSDNIIENKAKEIGKTYTEVFKTEVKAANKLVRVQFSDAIQSLKNIIWDQTNLTVDKRKEILSKLPKDYYKVAVFVGTPFDVCLERVAARAKATGKNIPDFVMRDMNAKLEAPSAEEGFDEIVLV